MVTNLLGEAFYLARFFNLKATDHVLPAADGRPKRIAMLVGGGVEARAITLILHEQPPPVVYPGQVQALERIPMTVTG
jgi:hypothetical protein